MSCHGNHELKHSQNKFFPGDNLFWHAWDPNEQFDPMETCPRVAM